MSRQQTPDIMENIMNGTSINIASEPVNNKAINTENHANNLEGKQNHSTKQESNKEIKLPKNKTINYIGNKEIKEEMKEKATFNLSLSILESLEDSWIQLKRQIKGELRITKTAIVETALEIAIDDLIKNKSESEIYKRMAPSK